MMAPEKKNKFKYLLGQVQRLRKSCLLGLKITSSAEFELFHDHWADRRTHQARNKYQPCHNICRIGWRELELIFKIFWQETTNPRRQIVETNRNNYESKGWPWDDCPNGWQQLLESSQDGNFWSVILLLFFRMWWGWSSLQPGVPKEEIGCLNPVENDWEHTWEPLEKKSSTLKTNLMV